MLRHSPRVQELVHTIEIDQSFQINTTGLQYLRHEPHRSSKDLLYQLWLLLQCQQNLERLQHDMQDKTL